MEDEMKHCIYCKKFNTSLLQCSVVDTCEEREEFEMVDDEFINHRENLIRLYADDVIEKLDQQGNSISLTAVIIAYSLIAIYVVMNAYMIIDILFGNIPYSMNVFEYMLDKFWIILLIDAIVEIVKYLFYSEEGEFYE